MIEKSCTKEILGVHNQGSKPINKFDINLMNIKEESN
jgi:hypothetical protein